MRGFLFYLLMPEPGPVGVNVDPLGEALGPRVLPDGLAVLLGPVTGPVVVELPALPVVVPFLVEPVAVPLAGEPPAAELPPADPLCASANVLDSAKAVANAIVVSFIVVSLVSWPRSIAPSVVCSARLPRDAIRQAARMRVLTRRQSSSIACRSR
jgi:hypothetical protein